ncbi:MAG: Holliday junction resolvase RuvX [Dehalococcoidia bacterium]|nr:putative pre-16S rRNA nuclease [Chloroflexota bacterium]MBT9159231.1 putative pre-16S rRNA nuclease [Chloroflexota bacterium]MBT9161831.1 putative pre-16S rRNA nuclease [Chloroflexota bacterium]
MRFLGLDVGDKRIGVAMSDPLGILASALTLIEGKSDSAALEAILDLVEKNEVGCVVVGLPRSMDGSVGKQAARVDAFVKELSKLTDVPIKMWDERLSTIAADRLLRDAGRDRHQIKNRRDAVAAAVILQGYLDRHTCDL